MSEPTAVRTAMLADTDEIAAIYRASEGAVRSALGAGSVEAVDLAAWFGDRMSAAEPARFFIAPRRGFIEIAHDGALVALYVLPACWGSGVADALHACALDYFRSCDVVEAHLTVIARNTRARRFYERRGWRCAGEDTPREIGGVTLAFVRYVLALAST